MVSFDVGGILRVALPPIPAHTVITCLIWYMVSSITSQLSKVILVKFTYPLFLLLCQFFIGGLFSIFFINCAKLFPEVASKYFPKGSLPIDEFQAPPIISTNNYKTVSKKPIFSYTKFSQILPMGIFLFVGKLFLLNATSLISLATVSSVKALSPIMIVSGYRVVYGVKLPLITYLLLAPLVCGVVLMIISDSVHTKKGIDGTTEAMPQQQEENPIHLSDLFYIEWPQLKGLSFCLLSTITYAAQSIYLKQLVTWDAKPNSNPTSLVLSTELERPVPVSLSLSAVNSNNSSPSVTEDEKPDSDVASGGVVGAIGLGLGLSGGKLSPSNSFFSFNPSKMIRQRNGSIRLPYSSSDLRLDLKNEEMEMQHQHYNQTVQQNSQALGNPLVKAVIPNTTIDKPDKMTIVLYCSIIGFVFAFSGFVTHELPEIFATFSEKYKSPSDVMISNEKTIDTASEAISLMFLVIIDSFSHFVQSILSFYLLGLIPALSYSIASMMKRIVIITVSIIFAVGIDSTISNGKWYGHITREQIFGLILISIGLYCYDRWGSTALKGRS